MLVDRFFIGTLVELLISSSVSQTLPCTKWFRRNTQHTFDLSWHTKTLNELEKNINFRNILAIFDDTQKCRDK
jgi:hypothetical protein